MRYLILLIFSLIFSSFISSATFANNEPKDDNKKNKSKNIKNSKEKPSPTDDEGEDEDDEEEDEEEESDDNDSLSILGYLKSFPSEWTVNDSITNIPAYDLYCSWNTSIIHPYKFDASAKNDTTYIFLQNEHQCDYSHPYEGHITSNFGPRKGRFHYGIDIKLEIGDSVASAFEGVVRIAQVSKTYGKVVVIRHNNGLETLYAHLDKILVDVGAHLEAGEILGLGGNTGRSTGSHLHFEIRFKGAPINPNDVISFEDYKLKKDILPLNKTHFAYLSIAKRNSSSGKYYKIKRGDTLSKIARRQGISVKKLCKLNKIKPSTTLRPGRTIRIS